LAYALVGGVGALLLTLAVPPQAVPTRLSHDELPAVLASTWWCSVDESDPNGKPEACDGLLRYSLDGRQVLGESCTVVSLDEVAEMGEIVDVLAPGALDPDRSLLSDVDARARAVGADRIKMCETVRYKRRPDGTLCSKAFELQPDTRWVLSSSGRREDEADIALTREEVTRLYRLVARVGPEVIASLPAEAMTDPDIKLLATIFGPDQVCESFSRVADGTLQSWLVGAGGSPVYSSSLVPITGPDAVRLEPAPTE
jgi:hypothetical protein